MAIRPVVFGGMMQSTAEIGNQQSVAENKPTTDQAMVSAGLENQTRQESHQVNTTEETSDAEYQYSQGGSGKRHAKDENQDKKKQKKASAGDGKVFIKGQSSSFDIKI